VQLLGPVLGTLPAHLLHTEVLRRLGPKDLASLAGAGRGCAAAVAATELMRWAKRAKRAPPEHHVHLPPLCLRAACSYAARGGDREVLEWLHNTGCTLDADTCACAAESGHLAVLQWARNFGCPWDSRTCAYAARYGHLEVLQWAREHGCPWGGTCAYAARGGHLEVLQWVRENDTTGAVWNERQVRRCAGGRPREEEVLAWLDGLSAP